MRWWVTCFCLAISLALPAQSFAAESQKSVNISVRILPRVSLSLSHSHFSLVGSEDDPVITSQEGPMTVVAKGRTGPNQILLLTVQADQNLEGPRGSIPIQQIAWNARGEGMNNSSQLRLGKQVLGRWAKGGVHKGQVDFALKNDGKLLPGDYRGSVTLTLWSP